MLADATRVQVLWALAQSELSVNELADHVRQLVTDAVFNAEHAGPGVPGHHRGEAEIAPIRQPTERKITGSNK
jgi:ArsR family transcriptional regulator, zinc-responsive transcriptional repressor